MTSTAARSVAPWTACLPWVLLAVVHTTVQPAHASVWLRTQEVDR